MAELNFVLPISKDDLLESNSPSDRYSVASITNEKDVYKLLHDVKRKLAAENDPFSIFEHFDVLFSGLFHFQRIDKHSQKRLWHVTVRACSQFKDHLEEILKSSEIDSNEKKKCVNALKMLVYLLTQQIISFETALDKKSTKEDKKLSKPKGGAKGRKTNDPAGEGSLEFDWVEESLDAMVSLHHLIQLPIQKLWSTPLVDEQFVSMVGNCCYKLLDDPDMHLVKLKPMRDVIFDVLGILVKSHFHTNMFVSTIVKSLKGTENVSTTHMLAKGVLDIAKKYHIQGLVCCVVNEVTTNGIPEFSSESNAARSYSDFLLKLAEGDPVLMVPGVDILMPLLDQDPYQLRNCVLGVLAVVLQEDLKLGELDDGKRKAFRDEIYSTLLDHFMDVHAFVRSKVCQIWINLLAANAIPMTLRGEVLQQVVARLEDKSAQVRKYAMKLLSDFLNDHDFVAKHGVEEVTRRLATASEMLAQMTASEEEIALEPAAEVSWINMEAELETAILQALEEPETSEEVLDANNMKRALDTSRRCLAIRKFKEAIMMLRLCEVGATSPHSTASLVISERLKLYKGIVKRVMFGMPTTTLPTPNEPPSETTTADSAENANAALPSNTDSFPNNPFKYINVSDKEVCRTKDLVAFLQGSHDVGIQLNIAVPLVRELLSSSISSDVTEAVDFFTAAQSHSLDGIDEGLHDMLELIWSPDETVKAVIAEAFRLIYIGEPLAGDSQVHSATVVKNLTQIVLSPKLRLGEKAALEMLVMQWIEKNHLTPATLLLLWDRFYLRVEATEDESRAALCLLVMVAKSEKKWNMVKNNMEDLIEHGLGQRGHTDFRIAMHTCQLLSNLASKKMADNADGSFRMPNDHRLFTAVSDIILKGLLNFENDQYAPMATTALNLIFKLSDRPDQIFETLGKDLVNVIIDTGLNDKTKKGGQYSAYLPVILSRLFSCIGHIGILLFHYLDKDIYNEIKKHRAENEKVPEKKKNTKKRRSAASFVSRQSNTSFATSITENDDELEGITAEDEDAELIKGICDKQILGPSNFLGNLSQLIEFVVTHPTLYENVKLRTAATVALGKMMAISQTFCEKNQENLVNHVLQADDPVMRSNGLLMLRDLAFRFPTLMEPTVSHLYTRLHDESRDVRANAMAALSSLILTEMVKAKSNIGQLARCIVDEDLDMVQRAKSLFKMMSDKGNQLYNALPDIISKMSNSEEKVEEEEFRTIMKFIMSLIQKDRQHELLVEKLCARFTLTVDERQWRDLAFCLSLLTYSDRSLRKLLDNMTNYADKLSHEPVFILMMAIADQTGKQAKPEMRPLVEEFMTRLLNCQEKGIDDGACTQKSQKNLPGKPKKGRAKNQIVPGSAKKRGKRTRTSSTTSEEEEDSEDSDNQAPAAKPSKKAVVKTPARNQTRTTSSRATPRKNYNVASSSDEDD